MPTICILPSTRSMLLAHLGFRGKGSKDVREFNEIVTRLKARHDTKIVLHLFSNNGFIFFGSSLVLNPSLGNLISAIVFDSCPCPITDEVAATGLLSAIARVNAEEARRKGWWEPLRVVCSPLVALMNRRQTLIWETWRTAFPRAPALFLYSRSDAVVPPDEIERFIAAYEVSLSSAGLPVEKEQWEDAEHCDMLFLQGILYSNTNSTPVLQARSSKAKF
ncbi:hypothetical protein GUITHDRAFT_108282 [Guillardia theta CCMP2712]|uniref:Uncharacterized protein n=1 Tax=Guillardia theta (strain CCMP2712) TaxID=905079 RepID=L1JCK4_GUITC|nr:hypothetical protein GUITHDRAFT_108282 [Guillardia theta CCMP2712]EKX45834.1 hypothetical protein GUITHDRAFT_108282 [Guillardia theta CCMP2712]|eukprot:XP_005832814.1 hypothetical protein GUITHDRAFT_108282 [Guillardia theta CCMP2712]